MSNGCNVNSQMMHQLTKSKHDLVYSKVIILFVLKMIVETESHKESVFKIYEKSNPNKELFCLTQTHLNTFRQSTRMRNPRLIYSRKPDTNFEKRFNEPFQKGKMFNLFLRKLSYKNRLRLTFITFYWTMSVAKWESIKCV